MPDNTFLSCSAVEELKKKADAKQLLAVDSSEDSAEVEQSENELEEEVAAGRGFYKVFKDLVPHSKDMKRRAAPLLASVREWCEANFCDIVSAIGYMLHAVCYSSDLVVAALGWRLFSQGKDAILTPSWWRCGWWSGYASAGAATLTPGSSCSGTDIWMD